jgi:hypothetical protein
LRRALHRSMAELLPMYDRSVSVLLPLADETSLDKYYDIYDMNEQDLKDSRLAYAEGEFEDNESLRVLKILVARFHTLRKIFLCCLLALEADGGKPDFARWSSAVDEMHAITAVVDDAEGRLRQILTEAQCKYTRIREAFLANMFSISGAPNAKGSAYPRSRTLTVSTT